MPWQMSHAAYAESESAELQTDVMRFMAILAFCLVAIFAIVQSIPATPAPVADEADATPMPAPEPVHVNEPVARPAVEPAPEPRPLKPVALQRAKPAVARKHDEPVQLHRAVAKPPAPEPAPVAVTRPAARPPQPATVVEVPDAPAQRPQAAPPVERGLSLRFESDAVLRSLVARGLVGLYAISGGTYYRMNVAGNGVQFQPGAAPAQYHEMIAATVPGEVRRSFAGSQVTWGVTLPAATSQQLARFVRTNYSGSLVITADARLALAGRGGA